MIAMIGVGIDKPWTGPLHATVETSLYKAFLAVCNIVFSFCMSNRTPTTDKGKKTHH